MTKLTNGNHGQISGVKLRAERQQMLTDYIAYISTSKGSFEKHGKYIDSVWRFLTDAEEVNRRGWRNYRKEHSEELVYYPWMIEAICDFLTFNGMGMKKTETVKNTKSHVSELKKKDVRQSEMINAFILWLQNEKDFSPSTLYSYTYTARDFFSYFDTLSQENAKRYVAKLEDDGKSPKTINLRITGIEKLADYLRKPIKLKRPKIARSLSTENIPTEKEYQKILEWCDEHNSKYAFFIRLMGTTGCRISELMQFTYEMIQEGSVVLKGKGSKYRRFFFIKQLQNEAQGKSGLVCVNKYGQPMHTRGLDVYLKTIGEKAGIDKKKMHCHAFRHFFAKMYLQKTKDVIQLADLLGHGSVDTTRIYLQKSYDEQKREVNRVVNW